MKEIPILFSTPMVQAILEKRKTMTRRICKLDTANFDYDLQDKDYGPFLQDKYGDSINVKELSPYKTGDRLWVRETWLCDECDPDCPGRGNEDECPFNRVGNCCYGYKAQYTSGGHENIKWRPSIFMPKAAARIWLEVTDVRVERLQDITVEDAIAEGVKKGQSYYYGEPHAIKGSPKCYNTAKEAFKGLWDSLNSKRGYGWDTNPWVWVVEFKKVESV